MKRKFKAKIAYTTDKNHPDTDKEVRLDYEDAYIIDDRCFNGNDDIMEYIKEDMALVAGGGYNTSHIHDVKFEIREVN